MANETPTNNTLYGSAPAAGPTELPSKEHPLVGLVQNLTSLDVYRIVEFDFGKSIVWLMAPANRPTPPNHPRRRSDGAFYEDIENFFNWYAPL